MVEQEERVITYGLEVAAVGDYTGAVNHPEIEDLLRDTLIDVAKTDLGWDIAAIANQQPARPIVDIFTKEIGKRTFSKYHLAKAFLRWTQVHEAADLTDVERNSWVDLIKRVNQALR